ncbi:hypothetical protein TL16_g08056 [Triparma laevis f. inornata]|uniref:Serine aminopeptidase S33 domain-containing protein n=1 Tax=Triparma laevis f. inornata TaxID=1714386 RepID=A0A9W7B090_9STRA|nr:hypothetical protein TL16_g08056 [Triparma laevis f. inornata]
MAAAQEHFNSDLDYFEPAHSYSPAHAPFKAYERCYVFIGGFGDPPSCYSPLVDRITKARSNSIALSPATQGWDCFDNFKSARTLTYKTWLRGCLSNLKLANTLSERVIVIGHSTGATVISKVLELNNDLVDEVYFTGPNLKANKDDAKAKRLLLSRLGPLIKFVLPVIKKKVRKSEDGTFRPCDTLNREYHKTGYYLRAFPVNSIIEMFKLQEQLGKNTWGERVKRVVFFKGEEDRSVGDVEEQVRTERGAKERSDEMRI